MAERSLACSARRKERLKDSYSFLSVRNLPPHDGAVPSIDCDKTVKKIAKICSQYTKKLEKVCILLRVMYIINIKILRLEERTCIRNY